MCLLESSNSVPWYQLLSIILLLLRYHILFWRPGRCCLYLAIAQSPFLAAVPILMADGKVNIVDPFPVLYYQVRFEGLSFRSSEHWLPSDHCFLVMFYHLLLYNRWSYCDKQFLVFSYRCSALGYDLGFLLEHDTTLDVTLYFGPDHYNFSMTVLPIIFRVMMNILCLKILRFSNHALAVLSSLKAVTTFPCDSSFCFSRTLYPSMSWILLIHHLILATLAVTFRLPVLIHPLWLA
jgi:hypothetical protein